MESSKLVPNTNEEIRIWRKGNFRLKQVVSNLLVDVIASSVERAVNYINKTGYTTFNYGELQMHSILVPSIADKVECFIMEYPSTRKRGRENHNARSDYYCRCRNVGKAGEYQLLIELKSNIQGIPCPVLRESSEKLWIEACKQIRGLKAEIIANKDFYDKPVVRVCMETISLYAHESRLCNITDSDFDDVLSKAQSLSYTLRGDCAMDPNLIVLWKCSDNLRKKSNDEWHKGRRMCGMLYVCHIMEPFDIR